MIAAPESTVTGEDCRGVFEQIKSERMEKFKEHVSEKIMFQSGGKQMETKNFLPRRSLIDKAMHIFSTVSTSNSGGPSG